MQPNRRPFPWLLAILVGCLVLAGACLVAYMVARTPSRGAPASDPITAVVIVPGSVECERWTSDSVRVSGRVQNTGTTSTSLIEVQMVVRDGSSVVARDTTYADQSELGRGEISGWTGFVTTTGAGWDSCAASVASVR